MKIVSQDGNYFYVVGGGHLYTAPVRVEDGNLEQSQTARLLFIEWARTNIVGDWQFEGRSL